MPINIPKEMPAREILEKEKIFVMDEERAITQDIRPLNILILNLMPEKQKTEVHLLRLLGNTPLQVNVSFLHMETHESKNVSKSHLDQFYTTYSDVKDKYFDGMIITGAPIEHLQFEDVNYWEELKKIMEWTKTRVTSVMHICWGAQAALFYHYGIDKFKLSEKVFGIFPHQISDRTIKLVRGFDDHFPAPHSRYTSVHEDEILAHPELTLLSSGDAGPFIITSKDGKNIMITGHLEYETTTLNEEYQRDLEKGITIAPPENYFPNDDPSEKPVNSWRSHSHLLFSNWLNYYVYQQTPFDWK
ncbi:homoserine O-acetyltransferase MetA [Lederbergia lenta]|uniref:Homoserine O-acetyltransferase n=1 Tax=Lederbergia lenta TaxID=1467 RepID=A0A2X4W432_LEDLE|nr:homoserine O-succinyltransferase [Lederbergia lenta]MCM3109462.1 homoserine O-succinyltransferase [Lederbergia lenta]MEC2324773.1 homoserine O-succinyltransferase [Lederbergia lenta]SQI57813.1 homoserine O-succinyltransferase [Lederbergia lenta]